MRPFDFARLKIKTTKRDVSWLIAVAVDAIKVAVNQDATVEMIFHLLALPNDRRRPGPELE